MRKLRLTIGKTVLDAELFDTPTADAMYAAAPFESRAATWGDEVYFIAPVQVVREDDARDVVDPGELAFRVEGDAVIVGFGPTPISRDGEIRLLKPSNIWGCTADDVRRLAKVEAGELVRVDILETSA